MAFKPSLRLVVVVLLVLVAGAQAYRPARTNPAVDPAKTIENVAPVPQPVAAIFDRACSDCHSSRTRWPWYTNVAPISWMIVDHVNDGRKELSFSEWGDYNVRRKARKLKEICDQVQSGEMPLKAYLPFHPTAKLTDDDRKTVCDWTVAETARLGPVPPAPSDGQRGR